MPAESEISFTAILRTLTAHGVEFIVVGGISATSPFTRGDVSVLQTGWVRMSDGMVASA